MSEHPQPQTDADVPISPLGSGSLPTRHDDAAAERLPPNDLRGEEVQSTPITASKANRFSLLTNPFHSSSGNADADVTTSAQERQRKATGLTFRELRDRKVIGLKNYGLSKSTYEMRQTWGSSHSRRSTTTLHRRTGGDGSVFSLPQKPIEELEDEARRSVVANPFYITFLGNLAAVKVMGYFLITWDTILSCALTVGLTCYWYFVYLGDSSWSGGNLDFILLAFAVISPISAALGMAFARRERALIAIADFRSFAYHLYLAHCTWDWPDNGGRAGATDVSWIEHCDAVLAQLIGLGDELSRFLSLPTATKSRHRMTRQGRREAARIMEVSYHLMESMCTQRMTRLTFYSERIKKIGLPSGEISRMRQYERFLSNNLEQLRMVKMYRTPQTLRSFARIFTLILPPFYAPAFAQVARSTHSLTVGILFGIITALGLSALFEGLEILEDPFTAYLALDGIDVREEFEVLHFAQLISTRKLVFPDAARYPPGRRAALINYHHASKKHLIGLPPSQDYHYHQADQHHRHHSRIPSQVNVFDVPPLPLATFDDRSNNSVAEEEGEDSDNDTIIDYADHVDLELGTLGGGDGSDIRETIFSDLDDNDVTTLRARSAATLSPNARLMRRKQWNQRRS